MEALLMDDYEPNKRSPGLRPLSAKHGSDLELNHAKSFKKRYTDEDSWTSVDRQELDHAVRFCFDKRIYMSLDEDVLRY